MKQIVDPEETPLRGPRPLVLWAPIVGPMLGVLVMLQTAYALVGPACRRDTTIFLHLTAVAMLAATLALTAVALGLWRERGRGWETQANGIETRTRFMAVVGMLSGTSSALIIIAQWLAILFNHPCFGV